VLSREIPERLIAILEVVPLVGLHEIEDAAMRIGSLPATHMRNQYGWFPYNEPKTGSTKGVRRAPKLRTRSDRSIPTPRQLRALELYATGLMYAEVGEAMGCSEDTVKDHLMRARRHLGAQTTAHAVAIAMRRGLLT